MPWVETTLQERRDRIRADFLARTTTGDAVLRRSVENVYSYVLAGVAHGLGGFVSWGARQVIPNEDADLDSMLRWANNYLTIPQVPAVAAQGSATFTGVDTTELPAGTVVTNRDGVSFTTDALGTVSGGSVTVSITAVEAGAAGNTLAGADILLSSPIVDIDSAGTTTAGLTGGADEETKLGVLERLRQRLKNPPRGGGTGDYVAWALEIGSVTRAYEFPQEPSTGWVTVIVIDDVSGPIPGAQTIIDAQENVDLYRPIAMGGAVIAGPTPQTLNLTWDALIGAPGDDLPTAKSKLEANVDEWVQAQAPEAVLFQPDIENAGQAVVQSVSLTSPIVNQDPGQYGLFTTINHAYT